MRVLVTGGMGFIGSHLVERLLSEGFKVRILDVNIKKDNIKHLLSNPQLELVKGNICNPEVCKDAVKDCEIISHLAALISVDYSIEKPRPFWEVNVGGTFNLLEAATDAEAERFHYMSSCEIYGNIPEPKNADEDYPLCIPRSPYAASKYAAESYCRAYHATYDFPIVIIRAFNVFGPRQKIGARGAMIANFITRVLNDEPPLIFGEGKQSRDWSFVTDIADGIFKSLVSKKCVGETINLCNGIGRTVKDVALQTINICGKKGKIQPKIINARPGEVFRSVGDYSKAKKLLDWKPKIGFEEGLERTIKFFRSR